ncbi:MAG: helicase RepA family protein [Alphaproteobacteria bacterium]
MDDPYADIRSELDGAPPWEPPTDEGSPGGNASQRPFSILTRGDISPWIGREPDPVPFVIADFVEQGAVALLVGEGGAGKSYIALTAAIAVAGGGWFYGREAMPGRAVCLFCEDSTGAIHARLNRLCRAFHIPMEDLVGRLFPLSLIDDPIEDRTLWSNARPSARLVALEQELSSIRDLRLLVLDNVTHLFDGDEISRRDVGGFLIALSGMARRLGIGIILIHHASKSQDGSSLRMASGSTAWIALCRAAGEVRKATGDEGPRFAVRKINNGREWDVELRWTDDGALAPVAEATGTMAGMERRGHEQTFLDCLAAVTAQGRTVSEGKTSTRYAPKVFAHIPEARGAKVRDLERAMEALFSTGAIRVGEVGRNANRKPILGLMATLDVVAEKAE